MSNLVERLRIWHSPITDEAADELERLREIVTGKTPTVNATTAALAIEIERLSAERDAIKAALSAMLNEIGDVDGTMTAWLLGQAAISSLDKVKARIDSLEDGRHNMVVRLLNERDRS